MSERRRLTTALATLLATIDFRAQGSSIAREFDDLRIYVQAYAHQKNLLIEIGFTERQHNLGFLIDQGWATNQQEPYSNTREGAALALEHFKAKVLPGLATMKSAADLARVWDGAWQTALLFDRQLAHLKALVRIQSAVLARDKRLANLVYERAVKREYGPLNQVDLESLRNVLPDMYGAEDSSMSDAEALAFWQQFSCSS